MECSFNNCYKCNKFKYLTSQIGLGDAEYDYLYKTQRVGNNIIRSSCFFISSDCDTILNNDDIINYVWRDFTSNNNLIQTVYKTRKFFEQYKSPFTIVNVRTHGYMILLKKPV